MTSPFTRYRLLLVCIPMLLLLTAFLNPPALMQRSRQQDSQAALEVLGLLNEWRLEEGLLPFKINPTLEAMALYQAQYVISLRETPNGAAMHVFHMNDYPAQPPRDQITDAHRVYPGDGVAPLRELLRELRRSGFRGVLSLELFNRDYWQQDALTVARTGLDKMRAAVRSSLNA